MLKFFLDLILDTSKERINLKLPPLPNSSMNSTPQADKRFLMASLTPLCLFKASAVSKVYSIRVLARYGGIWEECLPPGLSGHQVSRPGRQSEQTPTQTWHPQPARYCSQDLYSSSCHLLPPDGRRNSPRELLVFYRGCSLLIGGWRNRPGRIHEGKKEDKHGPSQFSSFTSG